MPGKHRLSATWQTACVLGRGSRSRRWLFPPLLALVVSFTPPLPMGVHESQAATVLGALLAAQASVAALSVAVMVFVLQGHRPLPADGAALTISDFRTRYADRLLDAYEHATGSQIALASIFSAFGVTGLLFLVAQPAGGSTGPIALSIPSMVFAGSANLAWILGESFQFFERARQASRPSALKGLGVEIDDDLVKQAARDLTKRRRQVENADPDEAFRLMLSNSDAETDAHQLVEGYLEQAAVATGQHRLSEVGATLEHIVRLSRIAYGELSLDDIEAETMSASASWTPASLLGSPAEPLRRASLAADDVGFLRALLNFEDWYLHEGVKSKSPALFVSGLRAHERTFAVAVEVEQHIQSVIDGVWLDLRSAVADRFAVPDAPLTPATDGELRAETERDGEFLLELAFSLERQLALAVRSVRADIFTGLIESSERVGRSISLRLLEHERRDGPGAALVFEYGRLRRLAILGATGLVIVRSPNSAQPFIDAVRAIYVDPQVLASDVGWAIGRGFQNRFSWRDWESEGAPELVTIAIDTNRYILSAATILLLEAGAHDPPPDFAGSARYIRDWYVRQAPSLASLARIDDPEAAIERGTATMEASVALDEKNFKKRVAFAELDQERVAGHVAGFLATRYSVSVIEVLFRDANGWALESPTNDRTSQRGWNVLLSKDSFTDVEGAPHLVGFDRQGIELERDLVERLAEEATGPTLTVDLTTAENVAASISQWSDGMQAPLVVLDGDWWDVIFELERRPAAATRSPVSGWSPFWVGVVQGVPVVQTQRSGSRRLCIFDRTRWGCVVRHQLEGQDLVIAIESIPRDVARTRAKAEAPDVDVESEEFASREIQELARVALQVWEDIELRVKDPDASLVLESLPTDPA